MSKSLQELENSELPISELSSSLIEECNRLYLIPLPKLSIENLRMLIGQNIGLKYIVPIALEILESNPLAKGDMFSGDLLANVIKVSDDFWCTYPELNNRLIVVKIDLSAIAETINNDLLPHLDKRGFK